MARDSGDHLQARQLGRAQLQGAHLLPRQVAVEDEGEEGRMAGEAFFKAGGLAPLPPEDPPRRGENGSGVAHLARQGDELVAAAVLGQGAPVAIQNPAPRGNDEPQVDPVLFRQQAVPLAVLGLQAMEAGGESPGDGELGPGEKDDAAG